MKATDLVSEPMRRVVELARSNVESGGRPFACVVMRDGRLVAESPNLVAQTHDPTAHAEILAIREASRRLKSEYLDGCEVYVMAYPCPMCLAALYYSGPDRVLYAVSREGYAPYYRDDRRYFSFDDFYDEFGKPAPKRRLPTSQMHHSDALEVYRGWHACDQLRTTDPRSASEDASRG